MTQNDIQNTTVPHDPSAKVAGEPLGLADKAFDTATSAAFSFKPISNIKQALCAIHPYAHDPSRTVPAYHYCTHNISADLHQCIVFDSNEPTARMIGVEYIIPERIFVTLDDDEKRYWHSHKFEIEAGILTMIAKAGVPSGIDDALEMPALQHLHKTYGKTWHFWQIDRGDTLPLGLPTLMKSFTKLEDIPAGVLEHYEKILGSDAKRKSDYRAQHLDTSYQIAEGVDAKGPHLEIVVKGDLEK